MNETTDVIELTRQDDGSYSTNDGRGVSWKQMPEAVKAAACRGYPGGSEVAQILKREGLWVEVPE